MTDAYALVEVLSPAHADVADVFAAAPLPPFAPAVLAFLQQVGSDLLQHPEARRHPDVVTFGFWCRPASLEAMRRDYLAHTNRLGRGVVFHIAPSNVPVNFAYSLVAGLLGGNANVVRVPTNKFDQVQLIANVINTVLARDEHAEMRDRIRLIRYERDVVDVTQLLSKSCDVRVIWGGDQSIETIRRNALNERGFDVTFADRYSACVIDAHRYLDQFDAEKTATAFYNDTYLFDQNACTAPHLVAWFGEPGVVDQAKERFWGALHDVVERSYEMQEVAVVDKLTLGLRFAAEHESVRLLSSGDNLINRVELNSIDPTLEQWRGRWGMFFEYRAESLTALAPLMNKRFQTVAYIGFEPDDLQRWVIESRLSGVDRVVPVGRTLDFDLRWDGYDLPLVLSRVVEAR